MPQAQVAKALHVTRSTSRRRSPTRRPRLLRYQIMPTRTRRSDMNEIEESLRTLSAAPPLRPSPSLDTMSRRASTYRSERRRRHLGGVGIVALLLGGGVVAGLGLASTGGIPRLRVADVTVPCPGPLASIDRKRVFFAPGRPLVFAGAVLGGSGSVDARGQTILLSPLKVRVSHYFRGSGPPTLLVDNHVTVRKSVLHLPQFGWGFAVGQHLVFSGDYAQSGKVNMDMCATVSGTPADVARSIVATYPLASAANLLSIFSSAGAASGN
jgi:hypothetical protein